MCKVINGTKMKFMSNYEFEGVSRLVNLCPWLVNNVSIYRKRFKDLRWSELQDHMLWPFDLFLKQA